MKKPRLVLPAVLAVAVLTLAGCPHDDCSCGNVRCPSPPVTVDGGTDDLGAPPDLACYDPHTCC
jgi:hypothetical protein